MTISPVVGIGALGIALVIGIVAGVWTLLIVASTVLVHQHYLADLAGGLTLAAVACVVSLRLFARDRGAPAG